MVKEVPLSRINDESLRSSDSPWKTATRLVGYKCLKVGVEGGVRGVGSRKGESRSQRCSYLSPVLSVFFILCELTAGASPLKHKPLLSCFLFSSPFFNYSCFILKGQQRGETKHLITDMRNTALHGQQLFDSLGFFSPRV